MHFFKQKQRDKKLVVTCEQCGAVLDPEVEGCANCLQLSKISIVGSQDKAAKYDRGLQKNIEIVPISKHGEPNVLEDLRIGPFVVQGMNLHNAKDVKQTSKTTANLERTAVNDEDLRSLIVPAPFKKRLIAAIIDHTLLGAVVFILCLLIGVPVVHYMMTGHALVPFNVFQNLDGPHFSGSPLESVVGGGVFLAIFLASWLIPVLYFALFESSRLRTTPGKHMLGLMVTSKSSSNMNFTPALLKAFMQQGLLYVTTIIAGIVAAISLWGMGLAEHPNSALSSFTHIFFWIVEFVLFASFMCVPFFCRRTQSLLDVMVGRLVVDRDSFNNDRWDAHISSNSEHGWQKVFRRILLIAYWTGVVIFGFAFAIGMFFSSPSILLCGLALYVGLIVAWEKLSYQWKQKVGRSLILSVLIVPILISMAYCIPHDYVLLEKSVKAVPIAERGFQIDPTGKSAESKRLLDLARKEFPDVYFIYVLGRGFSELIGQRDLTMSLTKKYALLCTDPVTGLLAEAEAYADYDEGDQAVSLYQQAVALATKTYTKPQKLYELKLDVAERLLKLDCFAKAEGLLTKLIVEYPILHAKHPNHDPELHQKLYRLRAQVYKGLGQMSLSQKDLDKAETIRKTEERQAPEAMRREEAQR